MSFNQAFWQLRARRRISMAEFGISSSSIHAYEKGRRLPSRDHLEIIQGHVGKVAAAQGSLEGPAEALQLEAAWYESHLVNLGLDREPAQAIGKLLTLVPEQQRSIFQDIETASAMGSQS